MEVFIVKVRLFLLLLLLLLVTVVSALDCSVCSKKIKRKFLKNDQGTVFCSKECFITTLPSCDNCSEPCEKGVFTLLGKQFCGKECMRKFFRCRSCGKGMEQVVTLQTQWGEKIMICPECRSAPPCYYCSLPGALVKLADQRMICRKCSSTIVSDPVKLQQIFDQIRYNLAKWYGFDRMHVIRFQTVGLPELKKLSGSTYRPENARILALMRYRSQTLQQVNRRGKVTKEIPGRELCQIFILHSVPKDVLIDAIVHELTHDHIRHNVGKVQSLASEEGFCELVASLYNAKIGNGHLNKMKNVNKDKVYGDGYRNMRRIFLRNGRSLSRTLKYVK